jgi:hypothetical protein
MDSAKNHATHALFRKICDDGTDWLFLILQNDGWAITCDGERVATGTSTSASVNLGIQKYLSFTVSRHLGSDSRHSLSAAKTEATHI